MKAGPILSLIRFLFRVLLRLLYRARVTGMEHYHAAGERVLIIANHTSYLDGILLSAFFPDRLSFVVNTHVARRWWVRPFLWLVDTFILDHTRPFPIRGVIRAVRAGRRAVIFPEGRITLTGTLMKVHQGSGLVADRTRAVILPVRIDGPQYSTLSRLQGRMRIRWFPPVRITVLPPRRLSVDEAAHGRERRLRARQLLSDLMTEMMFVTSRYRQTLFDALLEARTIHGGTHEVVEDVNRRPLSYDRLIHSAFELGERIAGLSREGECVGILLPNSVEVAVAFVGVHACGRVPAVMAPGEEDEFLRSACAAAGVRVLVTTRRDGSAERLRRLFPGRADPVQVFYVEELGLQDGAVGRWRAWRVAKGARRRYRSRTAAPSPDGPAVLVFDRDRDGRCRARAFSHAALLANRQQLAISVDLTAQDIMFSAQPVTRSEGLVLGMLFPLLSGVKTFLYPAPQRHRLVGEVVYDIAATLIFAPVTDLAGYARYAHTYDFFGVRYVLADGRGIDEALRGQWSERFGIRVLEYYAAGIAGPVLALNTPMEYRSGTVGRFLPGVETRLLAVADRPGFGRLQVRGPNVILGHVEAGRREPVPPAGEAGWYDTGDEISLDPEGYVRLS